MLAICHAAAVASFQILNVLVDPIKADIHLTDTQYSLMQGLAVGIFASLLGIPAANVADRGSRRLVVLVGVLTWSFATMACSVAHSSSQLFGARMLVGIGEVFLYPAALSMIADVAPELRLSSAIGAFGCGGPVGTAVALIGGGWLVRHVGPASASYPLPAGSVWRVAFMMCGAFGVLAAGLLLTVPEPPSRSASLRVQASFATTLLHLRSHWRVFAGVSGGMLALSFCVFATASWSPTMLVRVHGMGYASAGSITGSAALVGGVLGAWAAGLLTDKIEMRGHHDAALQVAIGVAILFLGTITVAALAPAAIWASAFLCLTYSLLGMPTVLGGTALQQISPPSVRAQVMAIQVLLVNLLALSLGPLTVAFLTDHIFARPASVGYALVWTVGAGALVAAIAFAASRRRFCMQRQSP